MNIASFIYDLIDKLTHGADHTVDYDVVVLSETPTTITAKWSAVVIMRVDSETPRHLLLPSVPIPAHPTRETRQIFIEWISEQDKAELNAKCHFKWLEDQTEETRLSWDDDCISDYDIQSYLWLLDDTELGDAIYEWFGDFEELDINEYPKRFHPYVLNWIKASSYE